jgi:glycerol uptake facilitator-like aquaporin
MPMVSRLIAEFIGTFMLTAAFIQAQCDPLYVPLALIGIVIMIIGVSGAHINPAITFSAWVTRKMRWTEALGYIIVQFLGAGAAWVVLSALINSSLASGATSTIFHAAALTSGKELYVFFVELLGALVLGFGYSFAARSKNNKAAAAVAIGFALLIALILTITLTRSLLTESYTGLTFLNPAVAFAGNAYSSLWSVAIYAIAPMLGGVIAFAIQDLFKAQIGGCDCIGECTCDNKKQK